MNQEAVNRLRGERPVLLQQQLELAQDFYNLQGHDDVSRLAHREISQEMAYNAIDLALPGILDNMHENGLTTIALVAPLRGGLALVTPKTVSHLQNRLQELGLDYDIELWATGVKRHPKTGQVDIYFNHGYQDRSKHQVHAVIFDWGTATGLTNAAVAQDIHEKSQHSVPYSHMTTLSMTLADIGKEYIQKNCRGINIVAATRADLDDRAYVYQIAEADGGEWHPVNPKDWGAEQFGMEIAGDAKEDIAKQIELFIVELMQTFRISWKDRKLNALDTYYRQKYLNSK